MKKILFYTFTLLLPVVTYASDIDSSSFKSLAESIYNLIKGTIIPLIISFAIVVFFYRTAMSIYKVGNDPKAVKEGKTLLIWGVVAFFVMVSLWGIIAFISSSLGLGTAVVPQLGHN